MLPALRPVSLPAFAIFVLLFAACGADDDMASSAGPSGNSETSQEGGSGASVTDPGSEAPFCDEDEGFFYQGEECAYCEDWASRHVRQVVSTMPEELLRCDAPEDRCTSVSLLQSPCRNRGAAFGCTEVVVSSAQVDALHAHDAEVAEQTCLSPGSTWQGCDWGFYIRQKWTCADFPVPRCVSGVCVDVETTDLPHVREAGGPGDTHDRLPERAKRDLSCDPEERAQLSTCEWLASMEGLLVGEIVAIRTVRHIRNEGGVPFSDEVPYWQCEGEIVPALEVEVAPRMRFGVAAEDAVTRVIVAPSDLMHWIPEPRAASYWGGIPSGVQERAADDLYAGTGRLMPRSWRNVPGQVVVLPIVAGDGRGGERQYGLGGHVIGLFALDGPGGSEERVLFQRSDACLEPYGFRDEFRDRLPADFLGAVAECYANGLPDAPVEGVFLPEAPLPGAAFDTLCREAR